MARNLRVEPVIDKFPYFQHFFGVSCPLETNSDDRHFGDLTAPHSPSKTRKRSLNSVAYIDSNFIAETPYVPFVALLCP
jgi:hypothetical protein